MVVVATIQTYVHNFQGLYQHNPQYISPRVYITLLPYYILLVSQCLAVAGLRAGGPEGAWAHPVIGPLLVRCMYARISNSILWSVFMLKA